MLVATAAAGLAALVAACGGSGSQRSGEASKSPQAILKDASAALRSAHSFRATGRVALSGQSGTVTVGFEAPASLTFDLATPGAATAKVILTGGVAYLNANRPFYVKQGGSGAAAAALLSGRWLKLPSNVPGLSSLTDQFKLSTLSHCLAVGHGTLHSGGTATVRGRAAVVIVDAGDKPGTTPGRIYIATSGPAFPLRIHSTGATRPGGKTDPVCKSSSGLHDAGTDVTFTGFNESLHIAAPAKAVSLSQIAGG